MEETSRESASPGSQPEPSAQYAFQVHDQSSMMSAALCASKEVVKAKRRRTSERDHAILEAAYQTNSKPDKAERAQIVSQVALGEKEVQIWFQNRRQSDRRKSKPLQPHELVAHFRNTAGRLPPQMTSSPSSSDTPSSQLRPNDFLAPPDAIVRPASRASSIHDLLNPSSSDEGSDRHNTSRPATQETVVQSTPPSSHEEPATTSINPLRSSTNDREAVEAGEKDVPVGNGQSSAKKRAHQEMVAGDTGPRTEAQQASQPKEALKRTSSMVRLAMTVDGAVKIRTNNEPTPSPEKPRATHPTLSGKAKGGFARSKSAMNSVEAFRESSQGISAKSTGSGFGRSRDSRTWEFYCDSSAKDALSTQAEAETAGSAISAINLIRSNSFKSRPALSPSLAKGNSPVTAASRQGKPKLSRAQSSLGRLQGSGRAAESSLGKKPNPHQSHVRSPSGDSDKENWAPGTQNSEHALRRTQPSVNRRPILRENEDLTFPDASSARKRGEEGPGTNPQSSPSKEKAKGEDMVCIQGLLSLSQGAWR